MSGRKTESAMANLNTPYSDFVKKPIYDNILTFFV